MYEEPVGDVSTLQVSLPLPPLVPLTPSDLERVEVELAGVAEKWHEIGSALRLLPAYLDKLKEGNLSSLECLRIVLKEWLGGMCPNPTWLDITKTLKSEKVAENELAEQLRTKYFPSETVAANPNPVACGTDNCKCIEILSSFPEELSLSFPYLEGDEEAKAKLKLEYEEVLSEYHLLISYVWRSLRRKDIKAENVIAYLESIDIFQTTRNVIQPLFADVLPTIKKCTTLDEVFLEVLNLVTFFNHQLLIDIMLNTGGTMRDRREIDRFRDKFYNYVRRGVTEAPPIWCLPAKSGCAFVRMTLDTDIKELQLHEIDSFFSRMSYSLNLSKLTFKLLSITKSAQEGKVDYILQIPSFARNLVFPFDRKQLKSIKSEKMETITCCAYHITVPELDPKDIAERQARLEEIKKMNEAIEASTYETPPSSPIITPLYASLADDSPFHLDSSVTPVPTNLEKLQMSSPHSLNYVAFVPNPPDRATYLAMLLCQHAAKVKKKNGTVKCMIVTNTKHRAHELLMELNRLLPRLTIHLFTGTEEDSMTVKLCLTHDIVLICTSGKLCTEVDTDVIKFNTISMILLDDCQYAMQKSPLESALHKFIMNKIYQTISPPYPHMVGVSCDPCQFYVSLGKEATERQLLQVAGGSDSTIGVVFTEDMVMDTYVRPPNPQPIPKPVCETKQFTYRDPKKDFMSHIVVRMREWESSVGLICPDMQWSSEYTAYVQSRLQSSLASVEKDDSQVQLIQVLEMLQCCSQALRTCRDYDVEGAMSILQDAVQTSSHSSSESLLTSTQFESFRSLVADLETLISQKNPILELVMEFLGKLFNNPLKKSRGVFFVDVFTEAQFLCEEISKSFFLTRPVAVPRCLVARYSTDSCPEVEKNEEVSEELLQVGKEGLEAFSKGESRLLIIPYAIEKDLIEAENIESDFDFIMRLSKVKGRKKDPIEVEYVLVMVQSHIMQSFKEMKKDFKQAHIEAALRTMPSGNELQKRLSRAQEDVMYGFQTRYSVPLSRRKKTKGKEPSIDMIQLRCKKCKVFACHGIEVFYLFVDGGKYYVIPHRDFSVRYTTKPYHNKTKVIKRVNKIRRIFCANCDAPWGNICQFPAKGCQLPVLKSKYFIFEMNQKYYTIKLWSDALFVVPPITACPRFHMHGSSMDVS